MPQDSKGRYYAADEPSPTGTGGGSVASAAKTTTTTLTAFATGQTDSVNANLVITAVTGTNPTLDVTLETTADAGTSWYTVGTFAQQTATQTGLARIFGPVGSQCRWKFTLGGTTPSFTCAITTALSRDN